VSSVVCRVPCVVYRVMCPGRVPCDLCTVSYVMQQSLLSTNAAREGSTTESAATSDWSFMVGPSVAAAVSGRASVSGGGGGGGDLPPWQTPPVALTGEGRDAAGNMLMLCKKQDAKHMKTIEHFQPNERFPKRHNAYTLLLTQLAAAISTEDTEMFCAARLALWELVLGTCDKCRDTGRRARYRNDGLFDLCSKWWQL
jgi:hypothetical protein